LGGCFRLLKQAGITDLQLAPHIDTVTKAVKKLQAKRLLLSEDLRRYIEEAEARKVLTWWTIFWAPYIFLQNSSEFDLILFQIRNSKMLIVLLK